LFDLDEVFTVFNGLKEEVKPVLFSRC